MAVPRPILLALLGLVFAATLFYAMAGARKASDPPAATPPATKSSSRPKAVRTDPPSAARPKPRAAPGAKAAPEVKARPAGAPAAVTRALARKHTVVVFFFQQGGAEDDAARRAVDALRGRPGVEVFSAPTSRLADYRAITGALGVSQAPAVVILGRPGRARLIEGFVDRETLAQAVADAR